MSQLLNSDYPAVRWVTVVASLVAGALIWEMVGRHFNPAFMAPLWGNEAHPGAGARLLNMLFEDDEFIASMLSSLVLFATGFGIALVLAVPLGIVLARVRLVRVALESYVLALYLTPMVALIPFILSIFGFDFWPKVIVVVLFGFFPVLYNTLEGARSVSPELIEVARAFRSSERGLWLDVYLPYTLPYVLTGVRQATGRALVGMIAAEFFLSTSGLGKEIMVSSRNFDMAGVLAVIIFITLLGVALMKAVQMLENRLCGWRGLDR